MKKIKLLATVTALTLIFSLIGCSTPSSSGNSGNSGSSSGSTNTGTGDTGNGNDSGGTGAGTSGGAGTGGGSSGTPTPPEPQYKWLMSHLEIESRNNTINYTSSTNYTYSFYNSDSDCSFTSINETNSSNTTSSSGATNNTSFNTKTVNTTSQTGNEITYLNNNYTMNGSEWVLSSESRQICYKYSYLTRSNYTKTYPAGTEITTNYTVELLNNSNGVERYKITYPAEYGIYCVYEFANNRIQKQIFYSAATDKKSTETDYIYSNNSILQSNNIEIALTQTKQFDSNEQLTTQTNQTLENVTLNANNTITVRLGNSTNTSTNYSYTTETFTRIQVPYRNQ